MGLFIFCAFIIFSVMKSSSGKNSLKYPPKTNCKAMAKLFPDTKAGLADFEKFASHGKQTTLAQMGSGYYQCFCTLHSKPTSNKKDLCYEFQTDKYSAKALNACVGALVAIINIVIRTVNIKLVDYIGFDTDSQRVSLVMVSVFVAQMVNTGVVSILTNANLDYSIISFLPISNQYTDIDRDWYLNIGVQIQKTMMIMAFMPYIEIMISTTIKTITRGLDRGFCKGKGTTKKTT